MYKAFTFIVIAAVALAGCQSNGAIKSSGISANGFKIEDTASAPYRGTKGRYTGTTGSGGFPPTGKLPEGWSYLVDGTNDKYCPGPKLEADGTWVFIKTKCTIPSGLNQRSQMESTTWSQNEVHKRLLEADISFDLHDQTALGANFRFNSLFNLTEVWGDLSGCGNPGQLIFGTNIENGGYKDFLRVNYGRWITSENSRLCEANEVQTRAESMINSLPYDGTEFNLRAEFDFLGDGDFVMNVYIDGFPVITHNYVRPEDKDPKASQVYMMMFGNYSDGVYDYTMTAKNFEWKRVNDFSDRVVATDPPEWSKTTTRSISGWVPLENGSFDTDAYKENIGDFDPSKFSENYK